MRIQKYLKTLQALGKEPKYISVTKKLFWDLFLRHKTTLAVPKYFPQTTSVLNIFSVVLTVEKDGWSAIRIRRWNAEVAVLHQFDHAGVLHQLVDKLRFKNSEINKHLKPRGQFYKYFMLAFFIWTCFTQLFTSYSLTL